MSHKYLRMGELLYNSNTPIEPTVEPEKIEIVEPTEISNTIEQSDVVVEESAVSNNNLIENVSEPIVLNDDVVKKTPTVLVEKKSSDVVKKVSTASAEKKSKNKIVSKQPHKKSK